MSDNPYESPKSLPDPPKWIGPFIAWAKDRSLLLGTALGAIVAIASVMFTLDALGLPRRLTPWVLYGVLGAFAIIAIWYRKALRR